MPPSDTFFAPDGRAAYDQLRAQSLAVQRADFVTTLLNAMPVPAMILNERRQIVAVNNRLLQTFGIKEATSLIGRRPGEALGCVHFSNGPDGCGTAPNCSVCGAARTILDSMESGCQVSGECRVMLSDHGGMALELEATASPLYLSDKRFTVFALKDISAEKRKQVMEHTFFHDIINTAGGIHGLACLLVEEEDMSLDRDKEYKGLMMTLSGNLIEEIAHQRRLVAAEQGEYIPQREEVDLNELLREVCELYGHHMRVQGRNIQFEPSESCRICTDPPVLRRIVGNMVLNAMEAIAIGGIVRISYRCSPELLRIEVSNPGEIPPDIQLNVFKRSFSSKAATGRGIGTYSMKLFGERYLGGTVGFTCADGRTTFFIELRR